MMQNGKLWEQTMWVRGTGEKESGLWPTPTTMDTAHRDLAHQIKIRQNLGLAETVRLKNIMYPTPTAGNAMNVFMPAKYVKRNKTGWTVTRKGTGTQFGAKLNDVVMNKLYPTPTARDYKDTNYNPITCKRKIKQQSIPTVVLKDNRHGGKLNPNFVEFLMAYPTNWTKIEQTELKQLGTQSVLKSSTKSEKQLRKPKSIFTNQKEIDRAIKAAEDQAKIYKQKK